MAKLKNGREWFSANCDWIDGRWHLNGRPVHAGSHMELLFPDGTWQRVRIESREAGRVLVAYVFYHGEPLTLDIGCTRRLRWPTKGAMRKSA